MNKKTRIATALIHAWRIANVPVESGIFGDGNVFETIQSDMEDALICMYGEENKPYTTTSIYRVLNEATVCPEKAAHWLDSRAAESQCNDANRAESQCDDAQPHPVFFTDEQIRRMQEVFGGYSHGK